MLTEQMKEQLLAAGLTKTQATSATAEAVVNVLMNADEKTLIKEARLQVNEMTELVASLQKKYHEFEKKIDGVAGFVLDIAKAQNEYGGFTDDKAKNAVAMYGHLLDMNKRVGAEGSVSVKSAGFALYAYLGGVARHDIHYDISRDNDD